MSWRDLFTDSQLSFLESDFHGSECVKMTQEQLEFFPTRQPYQGTCQARKFNCSLVIGHRMPHACIMRDSNSRLCLFRVWEDDSVVAVARSYL
jgi:hypothetical protein